MEGKTRALDPIIMEALASVLTRIPKYVSHYE